MTLGKAKQYALRYVKRAVPGAVRLRHGAVHPAVAPRLQVHDRRAARRWADLRQPRAGPLRQPQQPQLAPHPGERARERGLLLASQGRSRTGRPAAGEAPRTEPDLPVRGRGPAPATSSGSPAPLLSRQPHRRSLRSPPGSLAGRERERAGVTAPGAVGRRDQQGGRELPGLRRARPGLGGAVARAPQGRCGAHQRGARPARRRRGRAHRGTRRTRSRTGATTTSSRSTSSRPGRARPPT